MVPWAGPVLLSWAGLLGWREITAGEERCRETALAQEQLLCKAQQG